MILSEVPLETNDVIKMAEFYRKILRISSEDNEENKNEIHQVIISEGTGLTVYNNGKKKNNANENISLAFTVVDVDKEYKRLLDLEVFIIDPPKIQSWGAKNMHFL
jgi:predicted enzyme related to lactoylglutathione lyase